MLGRTSALLRAALANLAADPEQQSQRLAGSVIRDELALDFGDAYGMARRDEDLDPAARELLGLIDAELSVPPEDPLWTEDLASTRWTRLRLLAAEALVHMPRA